MEVPAQLVLMAYTVVSLGIFAITSGLYQFSCP
jgi:hypothetical protein